MKKVMVLLALVLFVPTAAFAASTITDAATTQIGNEDFGVSSGVEISVLATTALYSAGSWHLQGNNVYGTTHDAVGIEEISDEKTVGSSASISISAAGDMPTVQ